MNNNKDFDVAKNGNFENETKNVKNEKMEELKMKMSIKEISKIFGISEGTLRVWIKKGIVGVIYDENFVNNFELRRKIKERFSNEEIIEKLGFDIELLECTINERSIKDYIDFECLEIDGVYKMYNYSFVKEVRFIEVIDIRNEKCLVFENVKNDKLEIYRYDELRENKNYKFER